MVFFKGLGGAITTYRHDIMGSIILRNLLDDIVILLFGDVGCIDRKGRHKIRDLVNSTAMHHGSPVGHDLDRKLIKQLLNDEEMQICIKIIARMKEIFMHDSAIDIQLLSTDVQICTEIISGLVSLSDWIASDDSIFNHLSTEMDLSEYASKSKSKVSDIFKQ
ncbi:MAG: HD domain-containing protein, partial [Candidatus Methanomethylophilaceae archaeon]|nr:HD domain-containing protein [Candidatus Methanomethylophilaceae archaeon]